MKPSLRQFVRERANRRCEYCLLTEDAAAATSFHLEHILARQHGGQKTHDNMCWSCHRCNLHKGPNLSGRDPLTRNVVRLVNPRRQRWIRHFNWKGPVLVGRNQTGRATISALNMNDPQRIELRRMLMSEGDWLPDREVSRRKTNPR